MARRRPAPGRAPIARNARQGVLDSLLEGAGELVQSVANEVVPGVVGALDLDELVQRVDIQAVLDRVDVDVLLERVDIDALLARVDIDALLARTEFGTVISRSGSAVAGRALDVVRSQGVGLDAFIDRWVSRLLRRHELADVMTDLVRSTGDAGLEGAYANIATRAAAFVIDVVVVVTIFALAGSLLEWTLGIFLGRDVHASDSGPLSVVLLVLWAVFYAAYPLAVAGRTFGMSVIGLRAERVDGTPLRPAAAVVRVLTLPLSLLFLGIGVLLIVLRRDHRALHDLISGSVIVYSWHTRAAHLRFLRPPPVT